MFLNNLHNADLLIFKFQPGAIEGPGEVKTWSIHEVYHSINTAEMLLLIGCASENF